MAARIAERWVRCGRISRRVAERWARAADGYLDGVRDPEVCVAAFDVRPPCVPLGKPPSSRTASQARVSPAERVSPATMPAAGVGPRRRQTRFARVLTSSCCRRPLLLTLSGSRSSWRRQSAEFTGGLPRLTTRRRRGGAARAGADGGVVPAAGVGGRRGVRRGERGCCASAAPAAAAPTAARAAARAALERERRLPPVVGRELRARPRKPAAREHGLPRHTADRAGALRLLRVLDLNDNPGLGGTLPTSSRLPPLDHVYFFGDALGHAAARARQLRRARELELSHCKLSGTPPAALPPRLQYTSSSRTASRARCPPRSPSPRPQRVRALKNRLSGSVPRAQRAPPQAPRPAAQRSAARRREGSMSSQCSGGAPST